MKREPVVLALGVAALAMAIVYVLAAADSRATGGTTTLLVVGAAAIAAARFARPTLARAAGAVAAVAIAGAAAELIWQPRLLLSVASVDFGLQSVHIAIPLAFAALGGTITERSGVIDLALEAKLLFGAFATAAIGHATDSMTAGIVAGVLAGVAVAATQMLFALRLAADQVIVGIALNVVALAGTRFLLQALYHEGANSPQSPGIGDAVGTDPMFWLCVLATVAVPFAMLRTRWGLRLRAAGDRPDSLVAVGVSPAWARVAAGLVGGALAGAGGAELALGVGGFVADMSTGRGYIAIAMVILVGWRPALAVLACLGISAMYALDTHIQIAMPAFPRELAPMLPYLLTLVVIVIVGGRPPPKSLGKL